MNFINIKLDRVALDGQRQVYRIQIIRVPLNLVQKGQSGKVRSSLSSVVVSCETVSQRTNAGEEIPPYTLVLVPDLNHFAQG